NPELRLVSKQSYLASKSHFACADYLLLKYQLDRLFNPTEVVFKSIPKIFNNKTAAVLLGKLEFDEEKDNELSFYSIKNEWNEVVAKILKKFMIKRHNQEYFQDSNNSDHEELKTKPINHKASTVLSAININKFNGKAIEPAIKHKKLEAVKLLLKLMFIPIVKLLLDRGADIHADSEYAWREASRNRHVEAAKLLLD
ncbi:hypothetical protein BB560_006369, partial [Smittium megazygosporum]